MRVSSVAVVGLVVVGSVLTPGPVASPAEAQEAVFLVRHGERLDDSEDTALSTAGEARAARLAEMLRDARITHIFVTEYQRTANTGTPLADRLGLPLQRIPAGEADALVARVRTLGPTARVLVVGHSNTVPGLLKQLGSVQEISIPSTEYDNLFVLLPQDKAAPIVLRLRY
jgi:broad specificity phosphatase PhoE